MSIQNSADRRKFACDLNQPEPVYAFGITLRPSSAERVVHWAGLAAMLVEVTITLITSEGLYVYLQKYYVETPNNMYTLWFSCMPFLHIYLGVVRSWNSHLSGVKRLNKWVFNLLQQEPSWLAEPSIDLYVSPCIKPSNYHHVLPSPM